MTDKLQRIERLKSRLSLQAAGCRLVYEHETTSTNDLAMAAALAGEKTPCVFLADVQTNGRGRFERTWEGEEDRSLLFSLLFEPKIPLERFPMLTEVFALAVCRVLRDQCAVPALIKWPNDVIIRDRKVCGILTLTAPDLTHVVIGAGVNIRKIDWPDELKNKAISLEEAGGTVPEAEDLLAGILEEFGLLLARFCETMDMGSLKEEYESRLANIGKRARVTGKDKTVFGTAAGLDENGRLIFDTEDGRRIVIDSGEVTVSGIYGEE